MSMRCLLREVTPETLVELLAHPERIHPLVQGAPPAEGELVLEDSWHGLHFLLCGAPWGGTAPLDFIMDGGEMVGDEDVGQGSARGFSPMEVRALAVALGALSWDGLWQRWEPETVRAAALYRIDPDASDTEARLRAAFDATRTFVTSLAERERAMLIYMQ